MCTTYHETLSSCKILRVVATVIEFRFFNRSLKKKNIKNLGKLLMDITHILHQITSIDKGGNLHLDARIHLKLKVTIS